MGFVNSGSFIINDNVEIRGEMSYSKKLEDISTYLESNNFSVNKLDSNIIKYDSLFQLEFIG